ncbi:hypothetical protein D3C76_1345850 [compost metagenome]
MNLQVLEILAAPAGFPLRTGNYPFDDSERFRERFTIVPVVRDNGIQLSRSLCKFSPCALDCPHQPCSRFTGSHNALPGSFKSLSRRPHLVRT